MDSISKTEYLHASTNKVDSKSQPFGRHRLLKFQKYKELKISFDKNISKIFRFI